MRAEDKELEGPDLEREQALADEREAVSKEEELPELSVDVIDVELDHRSRLLDALQLILAREEVNLPLLYLPQRETHALEALQTAVTGNDSMGEFVYAEDRRVLLEQALAVLQQNLTHGEPAQLAELQSKFESMTEQVGELRTQLTILEHSQEELDEWHADWRRKRAADDIGDKGDKDDSDDKTEGAKPDPKPQADPDLIDFIAEALFAMAQVQEEQPSSLTHGPDRGESPKPRSSLGGPEIVASKPRSTLYDDDEPPEASVTATHDPSPQLRKLAPNPEPGKKG